MHVHAPQNIPTSTRSLGLVQCFTGDGKGKTSAALGVVLRALSKGWRVAIISFDKGGEHYSERSVLREQFPDLVDLFPTGLDRINPETKQFRFGILTEDCSEAERGIAIAHGLFLRGSHDLIVLDEINSALALGMLVESAVLDLIHSKPRHVEIILTGRNAMPSIIEASDLVTEMKNVKHYMEQGIDAREGIDF